VQKHVKTIATGNALIRAFKLSIFIFGLIFTPMTSKAQTDCPESTPPKFDPEHEPRTLCQKYSPPGKFPNRFGTTETHFASQIIWNLNNGSDVFTGDIDLVGELIIDQDFTLLNCKVRISPNVRIRVEADVTFTLDGSKLFCCQDMWQGIDLDYRSTVISRNITEIEDAMVAMESPCTATMSIRNTTFNRNIVGIRLGYDGPVPWDPCPTFPVFTQFAGNTFQCNAPLNGTTNGVSFVGVQVYKTNATIGALTSAFNTFRNIQFGVRFESQWWGTSAVNRCRFEGVLNDGIFMAQGNLRVERCIFLNNGFRGVNVLETRGLVAQYNNFNCNDEVAAQATGDNIYRHIQAAGFALNAAVDINHNFFGGNFSDPEKTEHLRGIELVGGATMGGGTNIRVDWNDFNFSVAQVTNTPSHEVLLSGEYPSGTSTIVEFNNFFLDQPTGNLGDNNLYGITLNNGNKNQVEVYSNTFNSGAWGPFSDPAGDWGINLNGSMGGGNVMTGNTFDLNPNTAFSVNFFAGIYSQDFTNTVFCENNLRESSYPMYFQGTSMGTQYFANTHTGGGHSFRVQDGFIGEQGIEGGEHHGNEWYDKWLNIIPTLHAYHFPQQLAGQSRIWAHTNQSVRNTQGLGYTFFSEYYPADIDPNQGAWFQSDFTGFPDEGDCITHLVGTDETDRAIAGGTIDALVQNPTHIWTGRRYLYAKLMQNPTFQDDYAEFGPFLFAQSQTSVGRLYAVEQKIAEGLAVSASLAAQLAQINSSVDLVLSNLLLADSILDTSTDVGAAAPALATKSGGLVQLRTLDSLYSVLNDAYRADMSAELQDALALNNLVTASSTYEQYEKTVNDIAIKKVLYQNGELTAVQVSTLQGIASECPKTGGHGVYRARGILTGCDEGNWNDNTTNCYPIAEPVQEQVMDNGFGERSTAKILGDQLLVYPNPANDGFFVRLPAGESGTVTITDAMSRVWKTVPFTEGADVQFVDLPNAPTGMYLCAVTTTKGDRQIVKVILTNK